MRLLHQRHDYAIPRPAGAQPETDGTANQGRAGEQSLPLRNPSPNRACGEARRRHLTRVRAMNEMINRRSLQKAAAELRLDVSALTIRDGIVIAKTPQNGARQLPIGTLVSGMSLALRLENDAPLKAPTDYTTVGKPVPRLDIPDKVNGRFTYM